MKTAGDLAESLIDVAVRKAVAEMIGMAVKSKDFDEFKERLIAKAEEYLAAGEERLNE